MSDATVVERPIAASNDLTARWVRSADERGLLASGACVWPLLAYLAAGADGAARNELEGAIGLPAPEALAAASAVIETVDRTRGASAAVGIWIADDVVLDQSWLSGVAETSI